MTGIAAVVLLSCVLHPQMDGVPDPAGHDLQWNFSLEESGERVSMDVPATGKVFSFPAIFSPTIVEIRSVGNDAIVINRQTLVIMSGTTYVPASYHGPVASYRGQCQIIKDTRQF